MASVSRQIGWSNESNLLYQILKQITRLTSVVFGLKPKYKVFTALLTQTGPSDPQTLSSGSVTKGVTYRIDGGSNGDFSNVGAPSNDDSTYFIAINNETPNSYGTCALLYDLGAPVATVLENTIGNIWFTYNAIGEYHINSLDLFTDNKKFINGANFNTPTFNHLLNGDGTGFTSQRGYFFTSDNSTTIRLITIEAETFSDNIISNPTCIEIRVYN